MGVADRAWVVLGTPFRCLGVPAEVQQELAALLQGFPILQLPQQPQPPPDDAVSLRLEPNGGGAFLLTDGRGCRWDLAGSAAPLSSHLEYRLVDEAIQRAAGHWVLHAGAVASPGGTCLIVGESGAGKTSLALWLWASGLRLVTDDLCPLRRGALTPEVFPRALHMDAEYSPRLLARLPPRPPSYPAAHYPFPAPEPESPPPPPITSLLVLERGPDPEGALEPLSQSEATHHLLKAVIKSPAFSFGEALADMLRLARCCRGYRLRSATPEGAAERALAAMTAMTAPLSAGQVAGPTP
ncbi:MAG TPA: hypothetical protein VIA62_13160 [Thermoanaerobaculia bacterium]|jgi:hypothetical protein|nr:hypothetical protein [Thermoanaerobaculia bacterium]